MATTVRREDYFDAALAILATNDHAGLKQARLCSHLEVTTGSFYNYFESWAQFKTEFLQHWLESQTLQLAAAARLEGSMTRRLRLLVEFACSLPHSAESAIRGCRTATPASTRCRARSTTCGTRWWPKRWPSTSVRGTRPSGSRGWPCTRSWLPADRAAAGRELVAVVPRLSAGDAAPSGGGDRSLPAGFLPAEQRNLRVRGVEPRNLEPEASDSEASA